MTRSAPRRLVRGTQAAGARRTRDRSPGPRRASCDSASTHGGSGPPGEIRRGRGTWDNSALIHCHQARARLVRAIGFVRIRTCGHPDGRADQAPARPRHDDDQLTS
jgi:hypothetical protein